MQISRINFTTTPSKHSKHCLFWPLASVQKVSIQVSFNGNIGHIVKQ